MAQSDFDSFRHELAKAFEIDLSEEEAQKEKGETIMGFTLDIADVIPVNVSYLEDTNEVIVFSGAYALDEDEDVETIFQQALTFSLFGARTRGGSFGYDPDSKQVIYSRRIPLQGLAVPKFREIIEETLILIAELIESSQPESSGDDDKSYPRLAEKPLSRA